MLGGGSVKGVIIRSCGATVVFVDKSTEEWLADHGALLGRCSRYGFGWCEIEASVGSVRVVVPDVVVEHCLEVPAASGERPVETLLADRADEAFGVGVRLGCTNRCPDHLDALGAEDIIERSGELGIPVSNEEPGRGEVGGHGEVAGLLGDPGTVWCWRDTRQMHPAAPELDEEQHVQPAQPERLDGEEVTGQYAVSLGPQERRPVRPAATGRRAEAGLAENPLHRGSRDANAQVAQLADDPR
jgi:hypothetical protein